MSTILAVDDSATMRKCLEITFEGTEFNLVTCDSASAAVEQVKTLAPALVIADVSLPPNDGYELCSTIKLTSPATPVLMLSSKQNPFDPAKGAQADDHIDKPFDTQVLQDRARQLIGAAPKASDTEVPGRAAAAQKPVAVPPTPAAGSKIPAPRRKRPTPAMMQPALSSQSPKPGVVGGRRTVPFAMPNKLKQTSPGGIAAEITRPAAPSPPPMPTPAAVSPPPMPYPVAVAKPTETLPGVASDAAAPVLSGDLQGKLSGLGLNQAQIEGVLALSREILEQVVWEVVPHLAEQMIQEEINRLTKE